MNLLYPLSVKKKHDSKDGGAYEQRGWNSWQSNIGRIRCKKCKLYPLQDILLCVYVDKGCFITKLRFLNIYYVHMSWRFLRTVPYKNKPCFYCGKCSSLCFLSHKAFIKHLQLVWMTFAWFNHVIVAKAWSVFGYHGLNTKKLFSSVFICCMTMVNFCKG